MDGAQGEALLTRRLPQSGETPLRIMVRARRRKDAAARTCRRKDMLLRVCAKADLNLEANVPVPTPMPLD